jgi:ABC-type antimicrobial peptide transport system permease subunit
MKFLIAILIIICFIISGYLFGRNVRTNHDYFIFLVKSSFFTSIPIYMFFIEMDFNIFVKFDFKAIIVGYLISLLLAIIFMAFMIYKFSYRHKCQEERECK